MNNTTRLTKNELYRKIQELSFVKSEIELFLDTHPDSKVAMDYYNETVNALENYMSIYQGEYGPILASSGIMNGKWAWVDKPWPWQNNMKNDEGKRR